MTSFYSLDHATSSGEIVTLLYFMNAFLNISKSITGQMLKENENKTIKYFIYKTPQKITASLNWNLWVHSSKTITD